MEYAIYYYAKACLQIFSSLDQFNTNSLYQYIWKRLENIVKANKNSRLIEKSNRNEKHIRSLLAGTEYTFEIRAIDKNNEESIPFEKKFSTAVPPPRQVSFSNEAETSITIR